jgi:hypothetical protein
MIRSVLRVLVVTAFPGAALAQVLTGEAAAPLLFAPEGAEVELLPAPFLPKDQAELLKTVGASQPYYGAIAVSPDEGIMVEATVAAASHHSTQAASVAALAACDAKRKGATPCAVVALIRPAGWKEQPFQLSASATAAFADYARVRRDKAFAISPATGAFGQAKGRDAAEKAVADCAGKAEGAADCAVVLEN